MRTFLIGLTLVCLLGLLPVTGQEPVTESNEIPERWTVPLEFPELEMEEVPEASAEQPEPIREPEDLGIVVYSRDGRFFPLELQRAAVQEKSPFLSAVVEQRLLVPGTESPVRFKQNEEFELYLRMLGDEGDPRAHLFPLRDPSQFSLIRFDVRKRDRKFSLVRSGLSFTERQAGKPLRIQLHGDHSFKMNLDFPLDPGEYSLLYQPDGFGYSYDLFCFGIDP